MTVVRLSDYRAREGEDLALYPPKTREPQPSDFPWLDEHCLSQQGLEPPRDYVLQPRPAPRVPRAPRLRLAEAAVALGFVALCFAAGVAGALVAWWWVG